MMVFTFILITVNIAFALWHFAKGNPPKANWFLLLVLLLLVVSK